MKKCASPELKKNDKIIFWVSSDTKAKLQKKADSQGIPLACHCRSVLTKSLQEAK